MRATGNVHGLPRGSLIYAVDAASAAAPVPPIPSDLAAADDLALLAHDVRGAIRAYERLLPSAPAELKPAVLNRLGRNYAATGQLDAALRAYARLEAMADGRVGSLPASLVGAYERCRLLRGAESHTRGPNGSPGEADECAVRVYEGLVTGRWPIEKPRFEDYVAGARAWLTGDARAATDVARLGALEARARVVAEEAGTALSAWQAAGVGSQGYRGHEEAGRVWMSFAASGRAAAEPDSLLVLPSSFLSSAVWAQVLPIQTAEDAELVLVAPGGSLCTRAGAPRDAPRSGATTVAATPHGTEISRTLRDGDMVWQVQARGRGPGRLAGTLVVRQRVYIATLLLMVASLVIGAVFVTRTVRREMEISRLKSQFVSAVSHEFRSPLTSIRQLAELLDRGVPSPDRSRQYFKVILDESERLSRLVERVLDFSRMEEGRREYTMAPIDTAPWLARVAADAAHALGGKRLETSIPAGSAVDSRRRGGAGDGCPQSPRQRRQVLARLRHRVAVGGRVARRRRHQRARPRRRHRARGSPAPVRPVLPRRGDGRHRQGHRPRPEPGEAHRGRASRARAHRKHAGRGDPGDDYAARVVGRGFSRAWRVGQP